MCSAHAHNQLVWLLVAGPEPLRSAPAAVTLASNPSAEAIQRDRFLGLDRY
jgi:hypothetical protein